MIERRGFLRGMLALGMAPAIVRASSLMPIVVPASIGLTSAIITAVAPKIITLDITAEVLRIAHNLNAEYEDAFRGSRLTVRRPTQYTNQRSLGTQALNPTS